MNLSPDTRLQEYRILHELGEGGFGAETFEESEGSEAAGGASFTGFGSMFFSVTGFFSSPHPYKPSKNIIRIKNPIT